MQARRREKFLVWGGIKWFAAGRIIPQDDERDRRKGTPLLVPVIPPELGVVQTAMARAF